MKTRLFTFLGALAVMVLVAACSNTATEEKSDPAPAALSQSTDLSSADYYLIQFHSEHRCYSCQTIEELSKETLAKYPDIPFRLINVDDPENEALAAKFEATGTALFLYNPATGEQKELTDFAFLTVGNKEKFIASLSEEIETFQQ